MIHLAQKTANIVGLAFSVFTKIVSSLGKF